MLEATETVTLYHRRFDPERREDVWERTVYAQASWYGAQASTVSNNGKLSADAYVCRIATAEPLSASPGDILVRGEAAEADAENTPALLRQYHGKCFVVSKVQDNRRGAIQNWHWKLEGA